MNRKPGKQARKLAVQSSKSTVRGSKPTARAGKSAAQEAKLTLRKFKPMKRGGRSAAQTEAVQPLSASGRGRLGLRRRSRKAARGRIRGQATLRTLSARRTLHGLRGAYAAGSRLGAKTALPPERAEQTQALQRGWARWFLARKMKQLDWKAYLQAARQFKLGYYRGFRNKQPHLLLLPTNKKVAVILPVLNEADTIARVLTQLRRLAQAEIIVVLNGSKDESFAVVHHHPARPFILYYESALGFDVGRAIGAQATDAEITVFLDGDMVIPAEQLLPFIYAIERGTDVALNDLTDYMDRFNRRDPVSMIKEFTNKALGRADLQANSLTAVPHALSQKAIERIGWRHLAIPPAAQAIAIRQGLKITAPYAVNVIRRNKPKAFNTGAGNSVEQMIIGDHLEALHESMNLQGERLNRPDLRRRRQMINGSAYENN